MSEAERSGNGVAASSHRNFRRAVHWTELFSA
jgi:hypothetical protein